MTASAAFYVSLNSGANQSGGVDAESEDTVDFVPASTVGWLRARWEIYDYPEGWTAPAGWSTAADGTVYNETVGQPPQFSLPNADVLFGVWMARCLVNEQIDTDQEELDGLLDDENAICLPSPEGLRDIGAREEQHFTTSTTRVKGWLRSYQRNLRALQNPRVVFSSTGATPFTAGRKLTTSNGAYSFRWLVNVSDGAGECAEYEVKAAYDKDAGVLSQMYAPVVTTNHETAGLAASSVSVTPDGNDAVELELTGVVAMNLTWKVSAFFLG